MATMNRRMPCLLPARQRLQRLFPRLGLALVCLASSGCRDPQLEADNARLQTQLQQTDERLQVATEQLKAANEQVTASQELLTKAEAEVAAIEKRMEEQKKVSDEEMRQLTRASEDARSQLAVANARLEQIQKANEEKSKPLSPVGIWALHKLGNDYRLKFYEDGEVRVQVFVDSEWLKNDFHIIAGGDGEINLGPVEKTFLSRPINWRQEDAKTFVIGTLGQHNGWIDLKSENEGMIFVADEWAVADRPVIENSIPPGRYEKWPTDSFGRRVPVPIKKVDPAWTPAQAP